MNRIGRLAVIAGAALSLALPCRGYASLSATPTVSDTGDFRVSWDDSSDYVTRLYLYTNLSMTRTRVGGPGYKDYVGVPVGTHTFYIRAYEWDAELRREYFLYQTPAVTVTVSAKRDYLVGVLSGGTTCANGTPAIRIFMDNEDDCVGMLGCSPPTHSTSYTSGWTGATYADAGNTNFYFCRVDGTQLKPLSPVLDYPKEYAVLKLANSCPAGSVEFGRFFDNEDSDNGSWSDNIAPSYKDSYGNFMIRFCLFRSGADYLQPDPMTGNLFPQFGFTYGVFAPSDFYYAISGQTGEIYTDDEDTSTADYFDFLQSYEPPLDFAEVYGIIDGAPHWGGNTLMRTALVSIPDP